MVCVAQINTGVKTGGSAMRKKRSRRSRFQGWRVGEERCRKCLLSGLGLSTQ